MMPPLFELWKAEALPTDPNLSRKSFLLVFGAPFAICSRQGATPAQGHTPDIGASSEGSFPNLLAPLLVESPSERRRPVRGGMRLHRFFPKAQGDAEKNRRGERLQKGYVITKFGFFPPFTEFHVKIAALRGRSGRFMLSE